MLMLCRESHTTATSLHACMGRGFVPSGSVLVSHRAGSESSGHLHSLSHFSSAQGPLLFFSPLDNGPKASVGKGITQEEKRKMNVHYPHPHFTGQWGWCLCERGRGKHTSQEQSHSDDTRSPLKSLFPLASVGTIPSPIEWGMGNAAAI